MLSSMASHLLCIDLNPLQCKREGTQVIEVLCCCTPIFLLLKWCFGMVSISQSMLYKVMLNLFFFFFSKRCTVFAV